MVEVPRICRDNRRRPLNLRVVCSPCRPGIADPTDLLLSTYYQKKITCSTAEISASKVASMGRVNFLATYREQRQSPGRSPLPSNSWTGLRNEQSEAVRHFDHSRLMCLFAFPSDPEMADGFSRTVSRAPERQQRRPESLGANIPRSFESRLEPPSLQFPIPGRFPKLSIDREGLMCPRLCLRVPISIIHSMTLIQLGCSCLSVRLFAFLGRICTFSYDRGSRIFPVFPVAFARL